MIECYFDDSGDETQNGERFVCLAGYLADDTAWHQFIGEWRHFLMLHELPYVHMKTIKNEQIRRGWDQPKLDAVLTDFINVIRKNRLIGIGVGIDAKVWKGLSAERRRKFGTAPELSFQRVVRKVVDRLRKARVYEDINFVFDQDKVTSKARISRYYAVKDLDPVAKDALAVLSFADAEKCYQLQAADLLVWETRRNLIRSVEGDNPSDRYRHLLTPLPGERLTYEWEGWSEKNIERDLAHVEQMVATGQIEPWWKGILDERSS